MRYLAAEHTPVKPLFTFFLLLALALAVVPAVAADSRTTPDARADVKGEETEYTENASLLLDIASVGHGHKGRLITHRLVTYPRWENSLLSRTNGGQISFYISTDRDAAFERRLDVALRRGKVSGVMRNRAGRVVGRTAASRPNRKTVRVAFARKLLGPRVRSYRWFAFTGVGCNRQYKVCGDRSPNGSLIRHRLP